MITESIYIKIKYITEVINLLTEKTPIYHLYNGKPVELDSVFILRKSLGDLIEMVNKGKLYREI